MTKKIDKTLREITEKIVREVRPEKIILFGSYAWGKPTKDSDLDLLVVKKTKNTRNEARIIDRLLFPRKMPLAIIVYTPEQTKRRDDLGDFFIQDILYKGHILYEKR